MNEKMNVGYLHSEVEKNITSVPNVLTELIAIHDGCAYYKLTGEHSQAFACVEGLTTQVMVVSVDEQTLPVGPSYSVNATDKSLLNELVYKLVNEKLAK